MNQNHEHTPITPIGITDFRNTHQRFGIYDNDRLYHIYCIGKTGVGKTTLLQSMAISDIEQGKGLCIIDPHGDIAEDILHYIPANRIDDVIYFNPANTEYPIAFNPLSNIQPDQHHIAASGLIATFKKIWADSWGPRLEHILRYTLLTLLEHGETTLLDIQPLLTNPPYRNTILDRVTSSYLLAFWRNEFEKYSPALKAEATASILNKLGLFQASIPLRNTVGQKTSSFQMRQVLDESRILICNLSKGRLGEDASSLLGSMLINTIQLAALSRADQHLTLRKPFFLYIDECQSYVTESIADILSESRKFGLGLFMAHQYLEQLDEKIRSALFGNVGTMIVFRVGAADAEILAKEFDPVFDETDLVSLPKYSMCLKLMIEGETSRGFSAKTIQQNQRRVSNMIDVIAVSQDKYGSKQPIIEPDKCKLQCTTEQVQQPLF